MVLLMIVSALAGCASGDPDGDGGLGIDPDLLDEMIENNLQDFINNTTVTVNQEIHYHNNTTNMDNSESNINVGSGGDSSASSSIIQVARINEQFTLVGEDFGNRSFVENGILQFPAIGVNRDLIYTVNSQTISLSLTCNEYKNAQYAH